MSFKYRVIGYSPEYAVVAASVNDFLNVSNFKSGAYLNVLSGAHLTIDAGSVVSVPTATTGTANTTIANTLFVDNNFFKKTGGAITGSISVSNALDVSGNVTTSGNITVSGSGTLSTGTGNISLNGSVTLATSKTLTLGGAPTVDLHAATKKYVDDIGLTKFNLVGGTLTGFLTLNSDPVADYHASTKRYVDSKLGNFDAGAGLFSEHINVIKSGSYSQTGNSVSISITNHGFGVGTVLSLAFGSGAAPNGSYVVSSVTNTSDFFVTSGSALNTSGAVTATLNTNKVNISSTSLSVLSDSVELSSIHTVAAGWLGAGGFDSEYAGYSPTQYYGQVKIDKYGRVAVAKRTTVTTSAGDGWYNSIKIQGGIVTVASNNKYLTQNDALTVFSEDITGSSAYLGGMGDSTCTLVLSLKNKVAAGTYTKLSVNTKGLVTNVANLAASDITTALGYTPLKDSQAYLTHYKGSFVSSTWGTAPLPLAYNSGHAGYTVNGTYLYLPKGIYHLTFWGANNWYSWYYSYWGWAWWSSYWSYYYNPAVIYQNGKIISSSFANYGGWWWYYNSSFKSDVSQDFLMTNVIEVTADNEHIQFGVPHLSGITFWYNIKVLRVK